MHLLKKNSFFIFLGIIFIIFLNGLTILSPLDRDESRFAAASQNMLENNDFIDIEVEGVKRYKKPIGIYWAQVISNKIFGDPPYNKIWVYRLPSLFSIFLSIFFIFYITKKVFHEEVAKLSCLFLITSLLIISEIHQAKSDGLLFLFITICNLILLNYLSKKNKNPNWKELSLFWISLSCGIMVKGPIIIIFVIVPLIFFSIFTKSSILFPYLRNYIGYIILILIVTPWFYIISIKSGGSFWYESVGKDLFSKVISGQESHGFPPGYYSIFILIFFWPASIFLVDLIPEVFKSLKNKLQVSKVNLFLIFSFIIPFLIYELIPTKLPHYVLPTYVPASILISNYILERFSSKTILASKLKLILLLLAPLSILSVYIYGVLQYSEPDLKLFMVILIFFIFIYLLIKFFVKKKITKLLTSSFIFQIWIYISLIFYLNPKLEMFWIAEKINQVSKPYSSGKIFHYGFNEPSLVFLLSHKAQRVSPSSMIKLFYSEPESLFVVSGKYINEFEELLKNEKNLNNILTFSGFNYSKGKYLKVSAFTNESYKK